MKQTQYVAREPDAHGFIDYPQQEHAVWNTLITRQLKVIEGRACQEYLDGIDQLKLPHDRIPQLGEVNKVLGATTGWQVARVPALIPFQTFFELLASKRFPVATFIRTPEEVARSMAAASSRRPRRLSTVCLASPSTRLSTLSRPCARRTASTSCSRCISCCRT